jgi:hypothetical protein
MLDQPPTPSSWDELGPAHYQVPPLPPNGVGISPTSPSVGTFPTGPLAIACFAGLSNMTAATFRALSCRNISCKAYMKRLQVIIQFIDEVAAAARQTQAPHLIVLDSMSRKKVLVLNRLVEPYQQMFDMPGMFKSRVWIMLDGTEPILTRAQQETAVRRAVCQTRFTFKQ